MADAVNITTETGEISETRGTAENTETAETKEVKHTVRGGISRSTLHILAMLLMLSDHLWATIFPAQEWMTCIGRLAFPIFAFMVAEGAVKTRNIWKYILRMTVFAVISEIPFNLMYASSWTYIYHQNVLWTFTLSLLLIALIEKVRQKNRPVLTVITILLCVLFGYILGMVTMVDYYGSGILMVLVFYVFNDREKWWNYPIQLLGLYYINAEMLGGYYYQFELFGQSIEFKQQAFAVLALIPIWLYRGRKGIDAKWFKYFNYAFYPAHMLIIFLIWQMVS